MPTAGQPGFGLAGAFPVYGLKPNETYPSTTTLCLRDFRLAGGLARHCQVREKRCFRCIGGQARPLNVDGGTGDFVKCCRAAGYVKSLSERSVVVLMTLQPTTVRLFGEPCGR